MSGSRNKQNVINLVNPAEHVQEPTRSKSQVIGDVFEHWRKRQKRPNLCRLTKTRKRAISYAMDEGYTGEDVITLITYMYESDSREARWMQGRAPGNTNQFLDIDNIMRQKHLARRMEAALNWKADGEDKSSQESSYTPWSIE